MGEVEEKQQKSSKTLSTDPNDYTIIKEGDAEILMLANNEVFYNKTQVLFSVLPLSLSLVIYRGYINIAAVYFFCG